MTLHRAARRWVSSAIRSGHRTVLLTYPGLGLGNNLYFALRAHIRERQGHEYRIQLTSTMRPWLDTLPQLRPFFVESTDIRLRDQREHIASGFFQAFGHDFRRAELEAFVTQVLLPAPLFADAPERAARLSDEDVLTVNVRRGDYYEVSEFRQIFGFDVAAYVHSAVNQAHSEHGTYGRVHVVSDDVEWCRVHLSWLGDYAERLSFVAPTDAPRKHLLDLALSPALVLTNSTFSYWGGYISNVLRHDNHSQVWAPRFFGRGLGPAGSSAWQLDPDWRIVEDPPSSDDTALI